MALPPLPERDHADDGYDWVDKLADGWYAVPLWGSQGWDLLSWPYQIVVHYDGNDLFALGTYTEGDVTIQEYSTRKERDDATNGLFVGFWQQREDVLSAPRRITDGRLGPYVER